MTGLWAIMAPTTIRRHARLQRTPQWSSTDDRQGLYASRKHCGEVRMASTWTRIWRARSEMLNLNCKPRALAPWKVSPSPAGLLESSKYGMLSRVHQLFPCAARPGRRSRPPPLHQQPSRIWRQHRAAHNGLGGPLLAWRME